MMSDALFQRLQELRETYRRKMNKASDQAEKKAAEGDMAEVSISSTESERYREAFAALNQAIKIVDEELDDLNETKP
jgi:hypothetical protein